MTPREQYEKWLASPAVDEETKNELRAIANDRAAIDDRFSAMLDFGTAGLRGVLGAGLFRMNVYTVRYATQGLAELVLGAGGAQRGVAIAYDCRHMSREFARETAGVLAANGIRSFLFDDMRPTPELSFAIRDTGAIAGVNITASHNPKEYNGYKVYWEDGAQLPPEHAKQISDRLAQIDIFTDVKTLSAGAAAPFITALGTETDERYLKNVLAQSVASDAARKRAASFRLIYTPFHGTGRLLVPEALRRAGFREVLTVAEQMIPDGGFPTVKSPNPEDKAGFAIAIEMAKRENVDLIIGTDPDADRVGIVVRTETGDYTTLTGNQVGVLLLDYLIRRRRALGTLPSNAAAVKSIVSTSMARAVCEQNGVALFDVLTGFKFIGEKIKEWEQTGEHTFLFGFEESYGYLAGTYARDKDAVVASLLIAEMACDYALEGVSLHTAMRRLYERCGWFAERVVSVAIEGPGAAEKMRAVGRRLRADSPASLGGERVARVRDYLSGTVLDTASGAVSPTGLPKSDVMYYELADGSALIVRPSGTEPKIKLYVMARGADEAVCAARCDALITDGRELLR